MVLALGILGRQIAHLEFLEAGLGCLKFFLVACDLLVEELPGRFRILAGTPRLDSTKIDTSDCTTLLACSGWLSR
jgi:hypothetical protein